MIENITFGQIKNQPHQRQARWFNYFLQRLLTIISIFMTSLLFADRVMGDDQQVTQDMSSDGGHPVIFVGEQTFDFGTVLENTVVERTLSIGNNGNTPLHIEQVDTGCGCTTVDYTQSIDPGSTGYITIKADTKGYAGPRFIETVIIQTNDPENPLIEVSLSGQVDRFALILPKRAILRGLPNKLIETTVDIIPEKKYQFSIKKVRFDGDIGQFVSFELKDKDDGYKLILQSTRKKPTRKFGKIHLTTDNDIQPRIIIPIFIDVRAPK